MSLRAAALGVFALTSAAAAQSALAPGDVGVVTSTGFWRLRGIFPQTQPINHLAPSAFDPSFSVLTDPRLEWESGTDSFLVSTGHDLYRVTITSPAAATIAKLSPNVGGPAAFTALDIHPGTGELYLYDSISFQVFAFAPPFAAGMVPDVVLSPGVAFRGMCADSRQYPPSVAVSDPDNVWRLPLDGTGTIDVATAGASAMDDNPKSAQFYLAKKNADTVEATTSTSLTIDLNITSVCAPVAQGPVAVAFNSNDQRIWVLAEEGVGCVGLASGGNHVVALPPGLGPAPEIITDPNGSGITGDHGDLALVLDAFAFPSPYGLACAAPSTGEGAVLNCKGVPSIGSAGFTLTLNSAPAAAPVFLIVGAAPLAQLLPSGCTLLVAASVAPFPIGVTDGNGKLSLVASIPAAVPAGVEAFLQVAFKDGGHAVLSNGLMLHFE